MSKYTMELRELFEPIKFNPPIYTRNQVEAFFTNYDLEDYLTPSQISTITSAGLWNKQKLASKIVDHYYMREIGQETIGLFKHYAKVTMQELMEEFLPLIYTNSIEYNPLENVDFTETYNRTTASENTGNSTSGSEGSNLTVASDTPQGQISKEAILAGNYATSTSASENNVSNSTDTTSSGTGTESSTRRIKGNNGATVTTQKLIEQYRNNIRAIDKEIIQRLEPLFMGLY